MNAYGKYFALSTPQINVIKCVLKLCLVLKLALSKSLSYQSQLVSLKLGLLSAMSSVPFELCSCLKRPGSNICIKEGIHIKTVGFSDFAFPSHTGSTWMCMDWFALQ